MPDPTEASASRALAILGSRSLSAIPEEVLARSHELFADFLAVALGGSTSQSSLDVYAYVRAMQKSGPATIIGTPWAVSPSLAALANGTSAHAMEMDDVDARSSLHAGVAVIPAALGVAEVVDATTAELLAAITGGYEVTLRIGRALDPAAAYRRGFHPTGVAGVFGAATAAGRLIGLTIDKQVHAFGIAATMASGSMEYLADGSWTKRLNAGVAAHNGVAAAYLARAGFTGPGSSLTGRFGLLHAFSEEPRPELLLDDDGEPFAIMRVALKPYGCCRYNHGPIDAALAIRAEPGFAIERVTRIDIGVLSAGAALVAEPIERKRAPHNVVEAQFSAPFAVAVALKAGRATSAEFTLAALRDPTITALMAVTSCYSDESLDRDYPARWPAVVNVTLDDGAVITRRIESPRGEPDNPMSAVERETKFRQLAGAALDPDAVDRLWASIATLGRWNTGERVAHIAAQLATRVTASVR